MIECDDYAPLTGSLQTLPVNVARQDRMGDLSPVRHDYSNAGAEAGRLLV